MSRVRITQVLFIGLALVSVVYFQNCAPPTFEAAEFEFASEAEPMMVAHESSDRSLPGQGKVKAETTYEALLVDRFYLRNLFLDVFGPSAANVASLNVLLNNASVMGSHCSVYEDHAVLNTAGNRARHRAMDACSTASVNYLTAQNVPKPSVTRQAYVNKACSDFVTTTATFNHVMAKISAEPNPAASPENLLKLFHLFYRAHPEPHLGLIESLQLMFSGPFPAKNEWRAVINAVCTSSHWQVL